MARESLRLHLAPPRIAVDMILGGLAGGALGSFVGPVAFVVGLALGALAGALLAFALREQEHEDALEQRRSDAELGIIGGTLGAPGLEHPPATVGTYSSASAGGGASSGRDTPDEGPLPQGG